MNTNALEMDFNKKLEGKLSKDDCSEQLKKEISNKDIIEQKKEKATKKRSHEQVNKYAAHDSSLFIEKYTICYICFLFKIRVQITIRVNN